MPLPKGTRYRVKTTETGKKVRLAFRRGTKQVIEAKNIDTGATHTPRQFAEERRHRRQIRSRR